MYAIRSQQVESENKVMIMKVSGTIKALVDQNNLRQKFVKGVHESLLTSILMYSSETSMEERKRFYIKTVQMDNLRAIIELRRSVKIKNKKLTELIGTRKRINEVRNENTICYEHIKE